MRPRYYVAIQDCPQDENCEPKEDRKVIVVGAWERKKVMVTKTIENNGIKMHCQIPITKFTLTLSKAICHPDDAFNEEKGVQLAIKRIKKGEDIGKLTTEEYTMLTPDHCQMIVDHKAKYIANNYKHYLPKVEL